VVFGANDPKAGACGSALAILNHPKLNHHVEVSKGVLADLAPAHQRGLYMGTYGMVWAVAFVCGPSLGMLLFSASPVLLWSLCGCLGLLAAAIISAEAQARPALAGASATEANAP